MINTTPRIRRLLCSCCGAETRGRQWYNRDTGYGLCVGCIEFCQRKVTAEQFERCYGVRGIHFDVVELTVATGDLECLSL